MNRPMSFTICDAMPWEIYPNWPHFLACNPAVVELMLK